MTYPYDRVTMTDTGGGVWSCTANDFIDDTPTEDEAEFQQHNGYWFRDISATEVHIFVDRMRTSNLEKATNAFWDTYIS